MENKDGRGEPVNLGKEPIIFVVTDSNCENQVSIWIKISISFPQPILSIPVHHIHFEFSNEFQVNSVLSIQ